MDGPFNSPTDFFRKFQQTLILLYKNYHLTFKNAIILNLANILYF